MPKTIKAKNIITAGIVLWALKNCLDMWWQYGTQISVDAAAGFAVGLLFAFFLFVQIKCAGVLYNIANGWWLERRPRSARQYGER